MLGNIVANMMIKPDQSPVFDDPENYGLEYEDVTFKAEDGVTLSGWLIKGSKDRVIIQSHFGVQCCRSGYTLKGKGLMKGYASDINFLRQAKYLNDAGYSVLMYDFRNHGNSGLGTMPWITWGPEESKDIIAAVDFITNHPDYKNVKAMVSVQPLDYRRFIDALGLPKFVEKSASKVIQKRTGIDYNNNTFMNNVRDITVPTLVIQNRNDAYLNKDFIDKYFNELQVEKEMFWIEIPKHKKAFANRAAAYDWIGTHPEKILEWFGRFV